MKQNKNIEKIYDLAEKFDFNELSESDKRIILKEISEEEFAGIRLTIVNTDELYSKMDLPVKADKKSGIKKIIYYPVEFYKVAATLLVLVGLGYVFSDLHKTVEKEYITETDTLIIEKGKRII